eukprot:jgi/Mesen1/9901/ME000070S09188
MKWELSQVVLANGLVTLTLTKPGGIVTGLQYGGLDNFFDVKGGETNRGGSTGFYTYAVYERPAGWKGFSMSQTRFTMKLNRDKFHYMALADDRQRTMPSLEDFAGCQQLGWKEANLLTNPKNPAFLNEVRDVLGLALGRDLVTDSCNGVQESTMSTHMRATLYLRVRQVDDKYHYSCDNKDNRVHGWISAAPSVGCWVINASDEARNGGLLKQNLTSHVGPTSLSMFHSSHYAGEPLNAKWAQGEAWRKVFGPTFVYVNHAPPGCNIYEFLWQDAKAQMYAEVAAWPYWFPQSPHFLKTNQRATVSGRLVVDDPRGMPTNMGQKLARTRACFTSSHPRVRACLPLRLASHARDRERSQGYQHWVQADEEGRFTIRAVNPGTYDLYAWVPGVFSDYKREGGSLTVNPGQAVELGELVYRPPRVGPTLWEIGIPDRSAAGFFVPEPDPRYVNRLYVNNWNHSQAFPDRDLVYTVGSSDWTRDWWWAQVVREKTDGTCAPTTWEVKFRLERVEKGNYTLRIALAASNFAAIQLRINDPHKERPYFDTMQLGQENVIARSAAHGLYHEFTYTCPPAYLRAGDNSFYFTQRKAPNIMVAVQYDYLRLEAPAPPSQPQPPQHSEL